MDTATTMTTHQHNPTNNTTPDQQHTNNKTPNNNIKQRIQTTTTTTTQTPHNHNNNTNTPQQQQQQQQAAKIETPTTEKRTLSAPIHSFLCFHIFLLHSSVVSPSCALLLCVCVVPE